jgi:hypothetical protein
MRFRVLAVGPGMRAVTTYDPIGKAGRTLAQLPDQQAQPIRLRWLPGDRSPHAPGGGSPILPAQPIGVPSIVDKQLAGNLR